MQNALATSPNHANPTKIRKFKMAIKYEKLFIVVLQLLTISFISGVQINSLFLLNSLIFKFSL